MHGAVRQPEPVLPSRIFARTPLPYRQVLVAMAALLLLMPISYRAGTEATHPHAVFQVWLDSARGGSHHHHGDHPPEAASHHAAADHHADQGVTRWAGAPGFHTVASARAVEEALDPPTLSPLKAPLSPALPLLTLAGDLLLLVVSTSWLPLWAGPARMRARHPAPEPPPPRRVLLPALT